MISGFRLVIDFTEDLIYQHLCGMARLSTKQLLKWDYAVVREKTGYRKHLPIRGHAFIFALAVPRDVYSPAHEGAFEGTYA
jgi:hypothetical protein